MSMPGFLRMPVPLVGVGLLLPVACFDPAPVDTDGGTDATVGVTDGTTTGSMDEETGSTDPGDETGSTSDPTAGSGCGNGIVEGIEECDLGAGNSENAACTPTCELARCGDGLLEIGVEECDDGSNGDPDDGCTDDCMLPVCGDGFLQPTEGETCDGTDFGGQTCRSLGWDGGEPSCVDCQVDDSTCTGCGDGQLGPGEACDDGNVMGNDGCEADCTVTPGVATLSSQWYASCARFFDGRLRCWGYNVYGQLGYGHTNEIGDNETPASAGDVSLGAEVLAPATGTNYSCALIVDGTIRCWGGGGAGRLGYGNTTSIGDDELPSAAFGALPNNGAVDISGTATQVVTGRGHTCALLDDGSVRCWGDGAVGQTGQGNTVAIGDDELPSAVPPVAVGGTVTQLSAGWDHTCALLDTGTVRCWGQGSSGRLGYGNTAHIGDNELPSSAGDVPLTNDGMAVIQVDAGELHNCALFQNGRIKCWGSASLGQLGYGNTTAIGDDEPPSSVGYVDVGGTATQVIVGNDHSCALLDTGRVRCWGQGTNGRLGYGNTSNIGDDETPASVGDIDIGGTALRVEAGDQFTCVLLDTRQVRCFGNSTYGQLGYGNTTSIGDDEVPSTAGDVPLWP